jgi:DNA repair photolyase
VEIVETSCEKIIQPCNLAYFKHELGPYVGCEHRCRYCYTQNDPEVDWDTQVAVFPDFRKRISRELDGIEPQLVFVGMDTDPYQPIEGECRHTRIALEEMAKRNFSASILTKSEMVIRDLDLLATMRKPEIGISVSFTEEGVRRIFERSSGPNEARVEALAAAKRAGIETYVLISPVMPLITDVDALIDTLQPVADNIWVYSLDIKSREARNWRQVESILEEHFPNIRDEFAEIAFSPQHTYWQDLRRKLETMPARGDLKLEIHV